MLKKEMEAEIVKLRKKLSLSSDLGNPDLSLVTIKDMAAELKQRENICFALLWIEANGKDNITIEGSGNPTQLVGLLARGQSMAISWADKHMQK